MAEPQPTNEHNRTEIERKAREIAFLTKAHGIGAVLGKFNEHVVPRERTEGSPYDGYQWGLWFILGEEPVLTDFKNYDDRSLFNHLVAPDYNYDHQPQKFLEQNLAVWRVRRYKTPRRIERVVNKQTIPVKHWWGTKQQVFDVEDYVPREYLEFRGKRGGEDWTQFDYFTITRHHIDTRTPQLRLTIDVPPDLAEKIAKEVEANPLFPDKLLKALYPDTFGPDPKTAITQLPINRIHLLDQTKSTDNLNFVPLDLPEPVRY